MKASKKQTFLLSSIICDYCLGNSIVLHTPLSASWLILKIQLSFMEHAKENQKLFVSNHSHLQLILYEIRNTKQCGTNLYYKSTLLFKSYIFLSLSNASSQNDLLYLDIWMDYSLPIIQYFNGTTVIPLNESITFFSCF